MRWRACAWMAVAIGLEGQPQPPVIRTETGFVEVSVVVRGRRAAASLGKNDFILLDNGQRRNIEFFSSPAGRAGAAPADPLPANVFSNRPEWQPVRPVSATVILLDALNTPTENQGYAKRQLLAALAQIEPRERLALYFLGRSLQVVHDFTSDPRELAAVLAAFRSVPSRLAEDSHPEKSNTGQPSVDALIDEINGRFASAANVERSATTLNALEWIADHLAAVPGRKNLIWLSSGFRISVRDPFPARDVPVVATGLDSRSIDRRLFAEETNRVARRASQANLCIYPVDAAGLGMAESLNPASQSGPTGVFGRLSEADYHVSSDAAQSARTSMETLAAGTGGRAYFDSNGLAGAVRSALEDAEATYVLGFHLKSEDLDGRYHALKVVSERKGVSLRHRRSYFAAVSESERRPILDAVASPLEANRILLTVSLQREPSSAPEVRQAVVVVDLHGVALERRDGNLAGHLEVLFVQQSAAGAVLTSSLEPLSFQFPESRHAELLRAGMPMGKAISLTEGCRTLRVIVHNRVSGALGSLIVAVGKLR